jgi:hypothetical protein
MYINQNNGRGARWSLINASCYLSVLELRVLAIGVLIKAMM